MKKANKKLIKKKPLIEKPIKKRNKPTKKKINLIKNEVKLQSKIHIKNKDKGYFKGQLTGLMVKSLLTVYPDIKKNKLSKKIGISQATLNKVIENKKGIKLETLKKVSQGLNSFLDSKKAIQLSLVSEHLKRYKSISNKALKKINEKVKNVSKFIDNLDDKEYLFFKIHYSKSKFNEILSAVK